MIKYQDLAREPDKLWNMKAKVKPILVRALGSVFKEQENRMPAMERKRELTPYRPLHSKSAKNTVKGFGELRGLDVT